MLLIHPPLSYRGLMLKAPAGQKRLYFFGGLVVSVGIGLIMIPIFLEYWVLTRLSLLSLHALHVLVQICAPTVVIVYFVGKALTNRMRNIPRLEGMRVILSFCLLGYVGMVLLLIPLEPIIVIPALFSSLQAPIYLLLASMVLFASGLQRALAVYRLLGTWRSSPFGWALVRMAGGILLFFLIYQIFL
jgi:hypothetical protein